MNEMIERVARAWCFENLGRNNECGDGCTKETGCLAKLDDDDLRNARAAIEAMRTPTSEMLKPEVVSRTEVRFGCIQRVNYLHPIMDIWPQMIDAALSEDGS